MRCGREVRETARIRRTTIPSLATLAWGGALYAKTVRPTVRQERLRWIELARKIPDPELWRHATDKLERASWHVDMAAMAALFAPQEWRRDVVVAQVALEILYDYLDTLGEQRHPQKLENGRMLFSALGASVGGPMRDFYALHHRRDDGGYLDALVWTCRQIFARLPSVRRVGPVARAVSGHCAEAQTLAHVALDDDAVGLERWAREVNCDPGLSWWEAAAGHAASVIALHALIAAAARPGTTFEGAASIARAYVPLCALATLLDSLDDAPQDRTDRSHSFVAYYSDPETAAGQIARVARHASTMIEPRSANHHRQMLLVPGVIGFYLASPTMPARLAARVRAGIPPETRPAEQAIRSAIEVARRARERRAGSREALSAG